MAWNEDGNDNITAAFGWLGTAVAQPLIIATENPGGTQDLPDPAAEVMRITAAAQGRRVGIGMRAPQRRLHVEPTEIHSGGSGAGLSFGNRQTAAFVEGPANGERWVWYGSGGTARLWSGTDKLSVTPNGQLTVGGEILAQGPLTVQGNVTAQGGLTVGQSILAQLTLRVQGNVGIGTAGPPENAEGWSRVLDVLGGPTTKLSIRTGPPGNIDARVLAHNFGWQGAPPGMIIGTRSPHSLSFYTNNVNRATITAGGSVTIGGNCSVRKLGAGGEPADINDPPGSNPRGMGGGVHTWDLEAEGAIWSRNWIWAQGDMYCRTLHESSDARAKTNVAKLSNVLDKLEAIRGVSFERIESRGSITRSMQQRDIGVIAQEVETVFPELVSEHSREKQKAVNYSGLTSVLIEAAKELKAENQELRSRIEVLERAA